MRIALIIAVLLAVLVIPVSAHDLTAPTVPQYAEKFMPSDQKNFGAGLFEVLSDALKLIRPDLKEAASVCMAITVVAISVSVLNSFPDASEKTTNLVGSIGIALSLLRSTDSLINLASTTITEISEYGKLLLPVMTTAMASQGGINASAALYAGTAFFDALMTSVIGKLLVPLTYLLILLAVASSAIGEDILKKLRDTVKSCIIWSLKTLLYVYTGYIGITGIISGTADASALKAAKLTISSVVPVVGGILSDASEAVLVSAGLVKNAAGIYGLFAILAMWIEPFVRIGIHYLLLKATGAFCSAFGTKATTDLIGGFSSALGLLLAMTAAICFMLLISIACFLKGVG